MLNGPIQIFEPVEENIHTIKKNLESNSIKSKVLLNTIVLSNKAGFGHMQKDRTLFLSQLSKVSADYDMNSVKVTTLDLFCSQQNIDHIDVLKVDVEGHEPEVLEGAKELLNKRRINIIILESHPESYVFYNSLEKMGFDIFYYDYDKYLLRRILPVSEENIRNLKPSPFHSNIILIQREKTRRIKEKLDSIKV